MRCGLPDEGGATDAVMRSVVVELKGGLGNQLFEYAAGRALALRTGARLVLDTRTGFARDRVYRRSYELDGFPIAAARAGPSRRLRFILERTRSRLPGRAGEIVRRPWGLIASDPVSGFVELPAADGDIYLSGHWQDERYFADAADCIVRECGPPRPTGRRFVELAAEIGNCNSVAVGVRRFEEVPGEDKRGVGGLTADEFYLAAAKHLAARASEPVFFVFSTRRTSDVEALDLPGEIRFVTHDDGYIGSAARLWLIAQCRHHIVSNSSFYWWAAWLAERQHPGAIIVASDRFANPSTVPARWLTPGQMDAALPAGGERRSA